MALPTRVSRSMQTVDPLELAQREFDSMLSRFFGGRETNGGHGWSPYAVDVREDADHIYVDAELPGFRKEDIDITLANQTLTIMAERQEEKEAQGKEGDYLLKERRFNHFQRSFTLPPTVDERTVDAKLHDGLLTIMLNKREETKPKKIQVS